MFITANTITIPAISFGKPETIIESRKYAWFNLSGVAGSWFYSWFCLSGASESSPNALVTLSGTAEA